VKFRCTLLGVWLSLALGACEYREEPLFPFYPPETETGAVPPLYAHSKASREGIIPLGEPVPLEYSFQDLLLPFDASLEISYRFVLRTRGDTTERPGAGFAADALHALGAAYRVVLRIEGDAAWELPWDGSFLGLGGPLQGIAYGVPLSGFQAVHFTIKCEPREDGFNAALLRDEGLVFEVTALRIIPRWYGFVRERGTPPTFLRATPFVSADMGGLGGPGGPRGPVRIAPLSQYERPEGWDLFLQGDGGAEAPKSAVISAQVRYEYPGGFGEGWYFLPAEALPPSPAPLTITGGEELSTVQLVQSPARPFPEPIPADPGLVLRCDPSRWRDRRYEVFRWDRFPSILIFDVADFAIQERLFKRLAFFVEKTGFTGRLMTDQEMEGLRSWNAHDYRAEDLAAFFELVRKNGFPLTMEERELAAILLRAGILETSPSGTLSPGEGAVISLSRESPDYLRSRFMAHEGFHGLFFIDEAFQEFCRRRWKELDPVARRFILSYFDYQGYNTKDSYLVVNEYMAHCLQQSASQAGGYFGGTLAGRIYEISWRRTVLPPRDEATGTWPDLVRVFSREAEALSAYVNRRWGLDAGRVYRIIP
jgi:hypothetical protein